MGVPPSFSQKKNLGIEGGLLKAFFIFRGIEGGGINLRVEHEESPPQKKKKKKKKKTGIAVKKKESKLYPPSFIIYQNPKKNSFQIQDGREKFHTLFFFTSSAFLRVFPIAYLSTAFFRFYFKPVSRFFFSRSTPPPPPTKIKWN